MKCYNHPETDAVAQCVDCGRGLCQECSIKWEIPLCDYCQGLRCGAEVASLNKELYFYGGLAIFGLIIGIMMCFATNSAQPLLSFAVAFPIYAAGWKWLNHLTDKFSLFATPFVWIVYFFIKLFISAFVGMFALPYRLYYIKNRKKEIYSLIEYGESTYTQNQTNN